MLKIGKEQLSEQVDAHYKKKSNIVTTETLIEMVDAALHEAPVQEAAKTNAERQEREYVRLVNSCVKKSAKGWIHIYYEGNQLWMEKVTGAQKVEGTAPNGKEPYADVVVSHVGGDAPWNVSMKGLSAPSLAGAGAMGIADMFPGFLPSVTPKVVKALKRQGFRDGDWFVNSPKDLSVIMNKIAATFSKKNPGLPVVFKGYGKKAFSLQAEEDATTGKMIHRGEIIPYLGNATVDVGKKQITIMNNVKNDGSAKTLPDMFFKLAEEDVRMLLAGTEEMGGPIDYTYKGPMDITKDNYEWDEQKNTLTFRGASAYDIDEFVAKYPDMYLRVRKRRADQPFAPELRHPRLGYGIFGSGLFSRESFARLVITDRASAKALVGKL